MNASPSMTYAEMKLRVANRAELISQDAAYGIQALTSEPAAGKIKRAIDDGVREFLRAHRWSFLTAHCEFTMDVDGTGPLNIGGDPTRYLLPEYVESLPQANMMWKGPDLRPGFRVKGHHYDEVVAFSFMDPVAKGVPIMWGAEFNPTLRGGMQKPGGIELRFWPKPFLAYTVGFRARLGYVPFSDDNQVGQWPAVHDLTAVAFAVRELFRVDRDPGDRAQAAVLAAAQQAVTDSLATSITRDDEDYRPQEMGPASAEMGLTGRPIRGYDMVSGALLVSTTAYDW